MTSLKNVISSLVPGGKKMDSKPEQLRFYVFTRKKLRDDRMKNHADLIQMYVKPNVFCTAPFAGGIERFKAGKVSFEDGHSPDRPVSVKNKQTVLFVKKLIGEGSPITIRERSERCDDSVDTADRVVRDDLNLTKVAARSIPQLLTDQRKKTES